MLRHIAENIENLDTHWTFTYPAMLPNADWYPLMHGTQATLHQAMCSHLHIRIADERYGTCAHVHHHFIQTWPQLKHSTYAYMNLELIMTSTYAGISHIARTHAHPLLDAYVRDVCV